MGVVLLPGRLLGFGSGLFAALTIVGVYVLVAVYAWIWWHLGVNIFDTAMAQEPEHTTTRPQPYPLVNRVRLPRRRLAYLGFRWQEPVRMDGFVGSVSQVGPPRFLRARHGRSRPG